MTAIIKTIGAIVSALQGSAGSSAPLTLDQAVTLGQTNAFAVQLQQSTIEKNREAVNEARGNLGPQIGVGANYTRYDQEIAASFGNESILIEPIQVETLYANLNWNLDIWGSKTKLLHASEANHRSAAQALKATYNDARLNVRQAYFSVLRAKAQIDVNQKALEDAQDRLDQGQKQYDQQQVAKLDVTRYKAQVAQSNADLIASKDNLTQANYALNVALARPVETPVSLVDVTDLPPLQNADDDLVRYAQAKRPEVVAALESIRALGLITSATESGLQPSLNFQVQYLRTLDPEAFSQVPELTTGQLMLNIPIFDSGVTHARVREARENENQAKINLNQTKLNISQEVRDATANLSSAKARLDNAIEQVKLAEEVYRLAKVRQDAGAGTYYEVIDAEAQLTQARNGFVSARYDYLIAYSQLQHAVGTDDVPAAAATK